MISCLAHGVDNDRIHDHGCAVQAVRGVHLEGVERIHEQSRETELQASNHGCDYALHQKELVGVDAVDKI